MIASPPAGPAACVKSHGVDRGSPMTTARADGSVDPSSGTPTGERRPALEDGRRQRYRRHIFGRGAERARCCVSGRCGRQEREFGARAAIRADRPARRRCRTGGGGEHIDRAAWAVRRHGRSRTTGQSRTVPSPDRLAAASAAAWWTAGAREQAAASLCSGAIIGRWEIRAAVRCSLSPRPECRPQ